MSQAELEKLFDAVIDRTENRNRKAQIIQKTLLERIDALRALLPINLRNDAERYIRRAMATFNGSPDMVAKCPADTFYLCVLKAAEAGLMIDGKLCYVAPFKGSWVLMIDYKGLVSVAKRSGQLRDCKPDLVYENDSFSYKHVNGADHLAHQPLLAGDRGKIIGAYASFILGDGTFRVCYMTFDELEKVRNMAPSKGGPWSTWREEMYKKCPIRRGMKMFCDDPGVLAAMAIDDETMAEEVGTAAATPAPLAVGSTDFRTNRMPVSTGNAPADNMRDEPRQDEPTDDNNGGGDNGRGGNEQPDEAAGTSTPTVTITGGGQVGDIPDPSKTDPAPVKPAASKAASNRNGGEMFDRGDAYEGPDN